MRALRRWMTPAVTQLGLTHAHLQASAQLTVGMFLASLPVFVRPLLFPFACLSGILFAIVRTILVADGSLGSHLATCGWFGGSSGAGLILAGAMSCLPKLASPSAYLPLLCVLSCIGLLPLAMCRPIMHIRYVWQMTIVSCVMYTVTCIITVKSATNAAQVWTQVISYMALNALIPAVIGLVTGAFVMPSSAAAAARSSSAAAVKQIGHAISRCSALLLTPDPATANGGTGRLHLSTVKSWDLPDGERSLLLELLGKGGTDAADANQQEGLKEALLGVANRSEGQLLPSSSSRYSQQAELLLEKQGFLHEELDDHAYLEVLRQSTRPWTGDSQTTGDKHTTVLQQRMVRQMRGLLRHVRESLPSAELEPYLFSGIPPAAIAAWPAFITAAEELVTHVAALEEVAGQRHLHLLSRPDLEQHFPGRLAEAFKEELALLATSCADIATEIQSLASASHQVKHVPAAPVDWQACRSRLSDKMAAACNAFWDSVKKKRVSEPIVMLEARKVRTLMFTYTLTDTIMQSVQRLELHAAKVIAAAASLRPGTAAAAVAKAHARAVSEPDNHHDGVVQTAASETTRPTPTVRVTLAAAATASAAPKATPAAAFEMTSPLDAGARAQKSGGSAAASSSSGSSNGSSNSSSSQGKRHGGAVLQHLKAHFAFLPPLLKLLFAVPLLQHNREVWFKDLPQSLSSVESFKGTLKSRIFQAGAKYFVIVSAMLVAVLVVTADTNFFVGFTQLFCVLTAVVVMFEKIEVTISRMLQRVVGSCLGATLGFLVMLRPASGKDPYLLMFVICILSFTLMPFCTMRYRVLVILFLYTCQAMILCAYAATCCTAVLETSDWKSYIQSYWEDRMLAVSLGSVVPTALSWLVAPWYANADVLHQVGNIFKEATEHLVRSYDEFYTAMEAVAMHAGMSKDGNHTIISVGAVEGGGDGDGGAGDDNSSESLDEPQLIALANLAADAPGVIGIDIPVLEPVAPAPKLHKMGVLLVAKIAALQAGMARDAVVWSRGPFTAPVIIHQLLPIMATLADRLAAVDLTLHHFHSLSPSQFSGWAWISFVHPLHVYFQRVTCKLLEVSELVISVLMEGHAPSRIGFQLHSIARKHRHQQQRVLLKQQLEELGQLRMQVHAHYRHLRGLSYLHFKASAMLANENQPPGGPTATTADQASSIGSSSYGDRLSPAASIRSKSSPPQPNDPTGGQVLDLYGPAGATLEALARMDPKMVAAVHNLAAPYLTHKTTDSIHFLSWLFAFASAMDVAMLAARTVAEA